MSEIGIGGLGKNGMYANVKTISRTHVSVERLHAEAVMPFNDILNHAHVRIHAIKDGMSHYVSFSFEDTPYGRSVATRIAEVIEEESARFGLTSAD